MDEKTKKIIDELRDSYIKRGRAVKEPKTENEKWRASYYQHKWEALNELENRLTYEIQKT